MFYVLISNGKAVKAQTEYPGNNVAWLCTNDHENGWTNRNDWPTMADAERIAKELNELNAFAGPNAPRFIATDAGEYVSPRYDICELPRVGDKVSKYFNGDSYPEGEVASISKSLKLITTTTGEKFYRRKQTGAWINNGTWSLISGHHNERNPSF